MQDWKIWKMRDRAQNAAAGVAMSITLRRLLLVYSTLTHSLPTRLVSESYHCCRKYFSNGNCHNPINFLTVIVILFSHNLVHLV